MKFKKKLLLYKTMVFSVLYSFKFFSDSSFHYSLYRFVHSAFRISLRFFFLLFSPLSLQCRSDLLLHLPDACLLLRGPPGPASPVPLTGHHGSQVRPKDERLIEARDRNVPCAAREAPGGGRVVGEDRDAGGSWSLVEGLDGGVSLPLPPLATLDDLADGLRVATEGAPCLHAPPWLQDQHVPGLRHHMPVLEDHPGAVLALHDRVVAVPDRGDVGEGAQVQEDDVGAGVGLVVVDLKNKGGNAFKYG